MPFRHISTDIKERVLWLIGAGYVPSDVSELLGVSQASIYRWQSDYNLHGTIPPPQNHFRGRPRILNATQTQDLLSLVTESPELYLDEIQDWVAISHDAKMSISQLHTLIRDAGITYKALRKAASERDEEARDNWRNFVRNNLTASMVIAVDESSKDNRTIFRRRGRAPRGVRAETHSNFVRGDRYSILAAIGVDGLVGTRIVPGSVDGDEFFDFIVNDILPQMNPYPRDRSVLILDNCPIHKSEHLREVVEAQGSIILFLPPYSPDFNPIEEAFSSIKAWIRRNYLHMMDSETPELDLLEACGHITGEMARNWFQHSGFV